MSGAILQPPTRPDAAYSVLFIEVSGYLPMCGHGTIGMATGLVETGMVEVQEPVTTARLDTPVGLVTAEVQVRDGAATAVTLTNVPAFCAGLDRKVTVHPGWFDRSPCGTGTSARMAQLYARGELPLHQYFVNASFIGTEFTGGLVTETTVSSRPAVVPTVTGRAWVTGTAQYFLDPSDPFPGGLL